MTEKPNLMESAMDQLIQTETDQVEDSQEAEQSEEVIEETEEELDNEEVSETEEVEEETEEESDEDDDTDENEESDIIDFEDLKDKKIKIGDEEFSAEDLKSGYMRNKDYTQKTQALAEERTSYEGATKVVKESNERLQEIYQNTEALFGALQSSAVQEVTAIDEQLKSVDWTNLNESDFKYNQGLKNEREKLVQNYQATIGKMDKIKSEYTQQMEVQKAKIVEVESKKLQDKYPVFKTEKGKEVKVALGKYLETAYGEDANKVSENLIDSRDVEILMKAYLYDEGQKKSSSKKTKTNKPVLKKSSTRSNLDDTQSRNTKNAKYKAKAIGGRQATSKLLENILN